MDPPRWLDELALQPGPPWHSMGTRGLDPASWLVADERRDEELGLKRKLLEEQRAIVSIAVPGSEPAQREVAELVAEEVGERVEPGWTPLEGAALLVQEDMCVLVRRDGHWRLDAAVVCFPSMWNVHDKRGQPLAAIHEPVPGYAEELAVRVDRFIDRLTPERPAWRRNWMIHATAELHLPAPPAPPALVRVPDDLWVRSERQTLRRLPRSDAVLFTIRTQHVPLAVLRRRPDIAERMAAAIRAWSPQLAAYRGAGSWREETADWMEHVAAGG